MVTTPLPIGHLLVRMGVISERQRVYILEEQKLSERPFGVLAEQMFGVSPKAIEQAWAEQYSSIASWCDPNSEDVDPRAVSVVNRRQAWQFRVMPLRFDGDDLVICTTLEHLVRALNFATRHIPHSCVFVMSDAPSLGEALGRYYPMAGLDSSAVSGEGLRSLGVMPSASGTGLAP